MKEYTLVVSGCDDVTYVPLTLTDDEYRFMTMVCYKTNKLSHSFCAPTMYFEDDDE
jgi:hypothetical protein